MQIIQPQPTKDAPYLVDDYPYGFRLRTQVRYWVETSIRYGQRLVFQSLNPKTQKWNAPKPSGYSNIVLAALDSQNHVTNMNISTYSLEEAQKFQENYGQYLGPHQTHELANMIAILQVHSKIEWTIRTKKYKNLTTGEISESVNVFDLGNVIEVNDFGDPVDTLAEKNIDRDINRAVNIMAIKNAAKATDMDSALATFKRVK